MIDIEQNIWGFTPEGEAVILYTIKNASGASVQVTNLGAAVVSVRVPDRAGVLTDVVLGHDTYADYASDSQALGKTIGRYAGRIAGGRFMLNNSEVKLTQNNGRHHADGGMSGYASKLWQSRTEVNRVVFSYVSPDNDERYPGELGIEVVYDWSEDNELEVTFFAKSSTDTVANLSNRTFFNLAGESAGNALNQHLRLYAEHYLPTDFTQIPTGDLKSVAHTPMDFRESRTIGRDMDADFDQLKYDNGYDSCWTIDGWERDKFVHAATLKDSASGRVMNLFTTMPAVCLSSGSQLQGTTIGKGGREYDQGAGIALQCMFYPDSPNKPHFPSTLLNSDSLYEEHIIYKFGVEK